MTPFVTVVIPALFDAEAVSRVLAQLPDVADLEIVVVDGGPDPQLDMIAATHSRTRLVRTTPGRGHQMNIGALGASGTWVLFLHADSTLPAGWMPAVAAISADVTGGWFRFALEDAAWQARLIERLVAWRVRYLGLPYGDQGFFVRRTHFELLGGFREWPLLEDLDFARRLVARGIVFEVPLPLRTSSRRWRRDGWWLRSTLNLLIVVLYFSGVPPTRLARWYHRMR